MKCQKCHTEVKEGSVFCKNCGSKLEYKDDSSDRTIDNTPISITNSQNSQKKKKAFAPIILLCVALIFCVGMATFAVVNINNKSDKNDNDILPTSSVNTHESNLSQISSLSKSSSTKSSSSKSSSSSNHRYEVVVDKIGWQTAKTKAEQKGGHLVTINSQEEFDKIKNLLSSYNDVRNVWVGACVPESYSTVEDIRNYWKSSNAKWITGESLTFTKWRSGEPSGGDDRTGVLERYLQIFSPKIDNYEWSFNDAGDDLSSYVDGILAYIVEYE